MANAVKRGISIKVITTNKSDVKIAKYAERWLYDWLLRNKIELYEYKTRILHGKLAICDDDWFTIGSYNINNISTYAALELNLDIKNKNKTIELLQFVNEIINVDCIKITKEYHRNSKNIIKQFSRWLSYQFIRIVFKLFTFYFKRKN
jgi:cardiolipin synthase